MTKETTTIIRGSIDFISGEWSWKWHFCAGAQELAHAAIVVFARRVVFRAVGGNKPRPSGKNGPKHFKMPDSIATFLHILGLTGLANAG
jgi:hypothetical protein